MYVLARPTSAMDSATPSTYGRHDLAMEIDTDSIAKLPKAIREAVAALGAGREDPGLVAIIQAQADTDGQLATRALNALARIDWGNIRAINNLMGPLIVDLGANPLRIGRTVNHNNVNNLHPILEAIHTREAQGRGCRTQHGGNLLHHLAPVSEHTLEMLLQAKGGLCEQLWPGWIHQAQDDGQTPLHVLWRTVEKGHVSSTLWNCTASCLRLGASLDCMDYQEVRVGDIIEHCMVGEPNLTEGVLPEVKAWIQARELGASFAHCRALARWCRPRTGIPRCGLAPASSSRYPTWRKSFSHPATGLLCTQAKRAVT